MFVSKLKRLLVRWQEFAGWTPLLIVLAVFGWIGLGALAPRLSTDALDWLIELPILSAYAAAAAGLTYLIWRRWRFKLDDEEQRTYWEALLDGERGAIVIFLTNAAVWLCTFGLLLSFFSPR